MDHFLGYSIMAGRQMPALESKKKRWSIFNVTQRIETGLVSLYFNKTLLKNKVDFRKMPDSSVKF